MGRARRSRQWYKGGDLSRSGGGGAVCGCHGPVEAFFQIEEEERGRRTAISEVGFWFLQLGLSQNPTFQSDKFAICATQEGYSVVNKNEVYEVGFQA